MIMKKYDYNKKVVKTIISYNVPEGFSEASQTRC